MSCKGQLELLPNFQLLPCTHIVYSAREPEQHQLYVGHASHNSATLAIPDCFAVDA